MLVDTDVLSREYTGWSLADIRGLSARERRHWMNVITYRNSHVPRH